MLTDDELIELAEWHYLAIQKKLPKFEHGRFSMPLPGSCAKAIVIVANCKIKQVEIEYDELAVMRSIRPG